MMVWLRIFQRYNSGTVSAPGLHLPGSPSQCLIPRFWEKNLIGPVHLIDHGLWKPVLATVSKRTLGFDFRMLAPARRTGVGWGQGMCGFCRSAHPQTQGLKIVPGFVLWIFFSAAEPEWFCFSSQVTSWDSDFATRSQQKPPGSG